MLITTKTLGSQAFGENPILECLYWQGQPILTPNDIFENSLLARVCFKCNSGLIDAFIPLYIVKLYNSDCSSITSIKTATVTSNVLTIGFLSILSFDFLNLRNKFYLNNVNK